MLMLLYLEMIERPEDIVKFEEVFFKYKGLMYYVANRLLWNEHDAEDAVQQAFIAIAKNIDKIMDVDCPQTRSYVVTIAENKSVDILRSKQRHPEAEYMECLAGVEIPLPNDHGLADAMAKLPARYREILLLRFDNGYDVNELCEIFNMSKEAMKKLIWRAKEALRNVLEEGGVQV